MEIKTLAYEISGLIRRQHQVVLLLDYDGTMVPLYKTLHEGQLSTEKKEVIRALSEISPFLKVCIVSGRDLDFLKLQLSNSSCLLFGEHASVYRDCGQGIEREFIDSAAIRISPEVVAAERIFNNYLGEISDSYIETKRFSIGFHYNEDITPESSDIIQSLILELKEKISGVDFKVSALREVIEVRVVNCDKRKFLERYSQLGFEPPDRFVAFGDDLSDFDLFHTLRETDIKIAVGKKHESFQYLESHEQVFKVLRGILN